MRGLGDAEGRAMQKRADEAWPELPLEAWRETYATLHLWTQIVGKVRLAQTPWINHSWHVTLYVTARGLGTSPIAHGTRAFQIDFDFMAHQLTVQCSDGTAAGFALEPQPVAAFYSRLMSVLDRLDLPVTINKRPNEVADPIPFDQDEVHRAYDPVYANRFWRVMVQVDRVLKQFRARFAGKCSPVHFFWGSFDLAVTRFSGRPGAPREGPAFQREAYSHEVISHGFWPGSGAVPEPAFYAYAAPEPAGLREARVSPEAAYYHREMGEFLLPYEAVRTASDPKAALASFVDSTYEAAATLAGWDRAALERCG